MKKILLTILSSLLFSNACFSQDIITPVSGKDIPAVVLEIDSTQIRFKKFNVQKAADTIILRSEVVMIDFEDGTKRLFNADKFKQEAVPPIEGADGLYKQGQLDAAKYYKGYMPAATGTIFTALLLGPLIGAVPAVLCASKAPEEFTLNFPNAELMKKPQYYNGYTYKAKKIKENKVSRNYSIGVGINLSIGFILLRSGTI
jgi:hypothetical protein